MHAYTSFMPISPARKIAFDVLLQVASQGAYASELLYARLGPQFARADAALATELTLGVLRWQRLLDFLLQRYLDRPLGRLDLEVVLALRLGLYQLRLLARVPAHAAVGESVELVKRARKHSAGPLVNAVLRRAAPDAKASEEELAELLPAGASSPERAGILHSHPTWLVERWMSTFGSERTLALLRANNQPPHLSFALLNPRDSAAVAESLSQDSLFTSPGRWLRSALTLSGGNPTAAKAFQSGEISIQDEASQMVAHLVDARPGDSVLDLCAAPGGKTLLLARAVTPAGHVTAADLHEQRLRSVREQLTRTATPNVELLALDATQPLPFRRPFDRILVDAPCSGTGTLGRNPEIRWRLEAGDLALAHHRQTAMLRQAISLMAPGGRLVYATCSLEPEENEQVVAEILAAEAGVRVVSGRPALEPLLREGSSTAALFNRTEQLEFFRTFPPETQTDGFFAAVLERRKERKQAVARCFTLKRLAGAC